MKTLLLTFTLILSINGFASERSSQKSSQSNCIVKINKDFVMKYMGYYEMMDALNNRGYSAGFKGDVASIELEFSIVDPYICSHSSWSIIEEIKDPLNKVVLTTTNDGVKTETKENMFMWNYGDKRVKRKIKKLIKNLPFCKID